jgi:TM2 domain-containing membrane protein YozV
MFCSKCGSPNEVNARFCGKCGLALAGGAGAGAGAGASAADAGTARTTAAPAGRRALDKNPTVALVLSIFLGGLGAGQFYNGDWKKGLAMAAASLTLGLATGGLVSLGVWIWSMADAYKVAKGEWNLW